MNDLVIDVVTSMSQLAVEKLTPFLRENGGWVRFGKIDRISTEFCKMDVVIWHRPLSTKFNKNRQTLENRKNDHNRQKLTKIDKS